MQVQRRGEHPGQSTEAVQGEPVRSLEPEAEPQPGAQQAGPVQEEKQQKQNTRGEEEEPRSMASEEEVYGDKVGGEEPDDAEEGEEPDCGEETSCGGN